MLRPSAHAVMVLSNPGTHVSRLSTCQLSLSAEIAQDTVTGAAVHDLQAHGAACQLLADANCSVIVDSKVVVGRRRRRRAGVCRHRPQGQSKTLSGLSGRRHGRWCCVRTLERPTLGSVRSFSTSCNANVRTIHATRRLRSGSGDVVLSSCRGRPYFAYILSSCYSLHFSLIVDTYCVVQ